MRYISILALLVSTSGASAAVYGPGNINFGYDATFEVTDQEYEEFCGDDPEICDANSRRFDPLPSLAVGDTISTSFSVENVTQVNDSIIYRSRNRPDFLGAPFGVLTNANLDLNTGDGSFFFGSDAVLGQLNFNLQDGGGTGTYFLADDVTNFAFEKTVEFSVTDYAVTGLSEVAPVPLPASGMLLLAGLGGLGVWPRRKSA